MGKQLTFPNTGADFSGYDAARVWCHQNDYAMGSMQRTDPIGLKRGVEQWSVAKWRNMTKREVVELDGIMRFEGGGPRDGTAIIEIINETTPAPSQPEATT